MPEPRLEDAVNAVVFGREAERLEDLSRNGIQRPNGGGIVFPLGRQIRFRENFEGIATRLLIRQSCHAHFQFPKGCYARKQVWPDER